MINRFFFLYCLTACSEYQLSEKKELDDITDETIVEDITDTEDITIDTGIEETGDNQIDEHIFQISMLI